MQTDRKTEEKIFKAVIQLTTAAEREAYVRQACGDDRELLAGVRTLLKYHDANSFLDAPIFEPDMTLEDSPIAEGPGAVIGRYKLLEKIGEGGMAVVYMAGQEEPIRRKVALKIIKLGMDTRSVIARFEAERQALAMMDHPNMAKVFDAGATETGRPYFVMELVTGVSITEYCDKNNLSTKERLSLFIQVCNAVQHAHQKGIIHRDIKPTNVMVTQREGVPVPKVIDFGIAKATNQRLTEKTLFTRYAHIIGTPAYMSPEQADLSDIDIDTRSDIYSLGVLLYELLTGTTPFSEQELRKAGFIEIQRVIREQEPPKPSTKLSTLGDTLADVAKYRASTPDVLTKAIRGDLDWIVMKSLEKNRKGRYDTASAFAQDVQRHLAHEPVLARAPKAMYRFKKFLRRHRYQSAAAVAIAVLVAAVIVVSSKWNRDRLQLAEAESIAHSGILDRARASLSGRDFAAALKDVERILDSKHVGPEARLLYAGILVEDRRYDDAVAELENLVNEGPEIAGAAHSLWARALWESQSLDAEKLKEVDEHRQKAERLLPETAESNFLRALTTPSIKEKLGFLDDALDELDPSHYESLRLRAYINYASKEYEAVESDARVMVALRPQHSAGYKLRGLAFRGLERHNEAIRCLSKAIELTDAGDQECIDLYGHRRRTYLLMGQYDNALRDAHRCVELDENSWMHHFHLFCMLTASGRHDQAEAIYRQTLASNREQFCQHCTAYVFDTLDIGQPLNLPQNAAKSPVFLAMVEASEVYHRLSSKAHRLIDNGFAAHWSANGDKLLYSCGTFGMSAIATCDLKSGKTELLTAPGLDPVGSPDGQYIVFSKTRSTLALEELSASDLEREIAAPAIEERSEIWVMKADGTGSRRLARGRFPYWSEDPQRIYFTSADDLSLYSVSIHDPTAQPTLEIGRLGCYASPSPDGRYVALIRGPEVHVVDRASDDIIRRWRCPPGAWVLLEIAMWTLDSKRVSITGVGEHMLGLWVYDVTTSEARRLLEGPVLWSDWSSHGRLAFGMVDPILDIWVASVKDLGVGTPVDQYCEDMIEFYERRVSVDPNEPAYRGQLERFRSYHSVEARESDTSLHPTSPWSNPTSYGAPERVWEQISARSNGDFCISPDGLELYFGFADPKAPEGHDIYDIWVAKRNSVNEPWTEPRPLGPNINSEAADGAPWLSSDGLSLYFGSRRPGSYGRMDLWVAKRLTLTSPWSEPENLGQTVNTPQDEYHPSLTKDGLTMYFSGFWFPREGSVGQSDIWVTRRKSLSDAWEAPKNLGPAVNSGYLDRDPFIAPDGSFLLFCSRRPTGYCDDIWIAERTSTSGSFSKAVPLSYPVNGFSDDACPFLSPDASILYFLSCRDDGVYRIWQVPILQPMDKR